LIQVNQPLTNAGEGSWCAACSAPPVDLEELVNPLVALNARKAGVQRATSACAKTSCGPPGGAAELAPEVWERVKDHPCYSEEAHHYFARMHVAVAPACNIQCNYCNRKYDCASESRPGVVSERLTPEQALRKVTAVASEVPQLSVLGIAGPGDACFDWRKARRTFELVAARIPDLKLCLSTNGLALPELVEEIAGLNVDHVTITINMVDPQVGAAIYPWVYWNRRRWTGQEASRILHERQMEGLQRLVARKILVKVNSVLIPGVNDRHLLEVSRVVKRMGAFLHNIMPLISDPAHGTHYGLNGQRGPSPRELKQLQDEVGGGSRLMRHCRQCRADAVGLLGEDRGQEFALAKLPAEPAYDPSSRETYREVIGRERGEHSRMREVADTQLAELQGRPPLLVAVATTGGGRINQHFGHAREFQIYEASGSGVRLVGHRKVDQYCQGGWGEDASLDSTLALLDGIAAVLCSKVGRCPREALRKAGVEISDEQAFEWIETGVATWYAAASGATERRTA
jgi:nitrogen fixation protein NifB